MATVTVPQGVSVLLSASLKSTENQIVGGLPSTVFSFEMLSPVPSHAVTLLAGVFDTAFIGARSRVWAPPSLLSAAVARFDGVIDQVRFGAELFISWILAVRLVSELCGVP